MSGALWDLRKAFIAELGHDAGRRADRGDLHRRDAARARHPDRATTAALIADDDDGDLGERHAALLRDRARVRHARPRRRRLRRRRVGSPIVDGSTISRARHAGRPPARARRARSRRSPCRGRSATASSRDARARTPTATRGPARFPRSPTARSIALHGRRRRSTTARTLRCPNNPADPMYQVFIGTATPICVRDDGHAIRCGRSAGTVGGEWQWGAPTGRRAAGDPTTAHTGSDVLGTEPRRHDGLYGASDVDRDRRRRRSNVSTYSVVHLQYWRWLTVEDGTLRSGGDHRDQRHDVWQQRDDSTRHSPTTSIASGGSRTSISRRCVDDGTMQIDVELTSDGTSQLGGWNLDDVCLVGLAKRPAVRRRRPRSRRAVRRRQQRSTATAAPASCIDELDAPAAAAARDRRRPAGPCVLAAAARRSCSSSWPSRSVSARMP